MRRSASRGKDSVLFRDDLHGDVDNVVDHHAFASRAALVQAVIAVGVEGTGMAVDADLDQLTSREREVLQLIARGYNAVDGLVATTASSST